MQKTGKLFQELLPRIIVPLDSAVVFTLYTMYSTALHHFLQCVFRGAAIKIEFSALQFSIQKIVIPAQAGIGTLIMGTIYNANQGGQN